MSSLVRYHQNRNGKTLPPLLRCRPPIIPLVRNLSADGVSIEEDTNLLSWNCYVPFVVVNPVEPTIRNVRLVIGARDRRCSSNYIVAIDWNANDVLNFRTNRRLGGWSGHQSDDHCHPPEHQSTHRSYSYASEFHQSQAVLLLPATESKQGIQYAEAPHP